jgi:hypothetical protein
VRTRGETSPTLIDSGRQVTAPLALKGHVEPTFFRENLQAHQFQSFSLRVEIKLLPGRVTVYRPGMVKSLENEIPVGRGDPDSGVFDPEQNARVLRCELNRDHSFGRVFQISFARAVGPDNGFFHDSGIGHGHGLRLQGDERRCAVAVEPKNR